MTKKLTFFLLMVIILCGCHRQEEILFENKDELNIIVATDLHYYASELFEDCSWFNQAWLDEDGQMIAYTHEFVQLFVKEVIQQNPDLVIISGDLTFNGEKVSHEQLASLLQQLEDNGIEVAVINGNHDVNNFLSLGYNEQGSYSVENIDAQQFKTIYNNFGYSQAYSQDSHSLSYALHLNETYDLLVVDTCKDESYSTASALSDQTVDWIEKQLKTTAKNNKKTIVSMHHNLTIHCDAIYLGYVLNNATQMQELFNQYHVPLVLSGHIHTQNIKQVNDTYEIVTSALSIAPVQYGMLNITDDSMDYVSLEIENVLGDEDFFKTVSFNKFSNQFQPYFDEDTANQLATFLAEVNWYYFSGNGYLKNDEFKQNPLLEILNTKEELSFYTSYINAMLSESTNHQELHISLND